MNWRRLPEVGTTWGIRFVVAVANLFGRKLATLFLFFVAFYYALASSRARRSSKEWFSRIGLPPTFANVVRHVHTFARVALDRVFLVQDHRSPFAFARHGREHIDGLVAAKRGAILIGSHVGSFEAMGATGRGEGKMISMVVDASSAERLGRVLHQIAPKAEVHLIPVDRTGFGTALKVKQAVAAGGLVGILADRAAENEDRNVIVDFCGAPASFPAGPWLIAHALGCPVYLVFGIFRPPSGYELHCVQFAERVTLERGDRMGSVTRYVQMYAKELEKYARDAPYNWFNFYDFWKAPIEQRTGQKNV